MSKHIAEPEIKIGPLFDAVDVGLTVRDVWFEGPREEDEAARKKRLRGQMLDVFNAVRDGEEYTLAELSRQTGHPPASISAQLRHLRKERFGSYIINKNHKGRGLYFYRLELEVDGNPARSSSSAI